MISQNYKKWKISILCVGAIRLFYSERKIEEEYADEKKIVIKIKVENLFN